MVNQFMALGSAIYGYLNQASTVPVYGHLAAQGSAMPYVTFHALANMQEYTFDSEGLGADYVIKVLSNRTYPDAEAYPIWTHIGTAMQNANLTIPGYTLLRCESRGAIEFQDSDQFWNVGYIYRIEAHKI